MSGNFFSKLFSSTPSLDRRTPVQLTEAVRAGDRNALATLEKRAHMGNPDAQLELGFLYAKGIGVNQSYSNAAAWYTKAADQGILNAQYNLGVMYFKGEGVDQDYSLALECFEKASSQGHANAHDLVLKLRPAVQVLQQESLLNKALGRNVVPGIRDDELAKRYLLELQTITEDQGVRKSIQTHLIGFGVAPGTIQEVERCIELSKKFSSVSGAPVDDILQLAAQGDLGSILQKFEIPSSSESADSDEPQDRAESYDYTDATPEFLETLDQAMAGDLTAQYNLGVRFLNGLGVGKNEKNAYRSFLNAAARNHPKAQFNLGIMFNTGTGVTEDPAKAIDWLTRAADQDHAGAAFNLSALYHEGRGTPQNNETAYKYIAQAARLGHPPAIYALQRMQK